MNMAIPMRRRVVPAPPAITKIQPLKFAEQFGDVDRILFLATEAFGEILAVRIVRLQSVVLRLTVD
jgi:hypothetical protein